MENWGTPLTATAQKLLLLGSGELGKEVVIEAQRLGIEVIAADSYANAPAMQVAHSARVLNMQDPEAIRQLVAEIRPTWIVPEVEAIATETLVELETEGWRVIPTARAVRLTMDREGIRRLAAEELGLKTSPYRFASNLEEYRQAVADIGLPCVIKPVMSSSGKGQSVVRVPESIDAAWEYALSGSRGKSLRVIVEGFVPFDYEITLLTVRSVEGTHFCPPIGHLQIDGDYRESWQPHPMSITALEASQQIAEQITTALGGYGIFGVELFVAGETIYFSEVSPRPHDTGMVTMISQNQSEFELHVRAITGLPIGIIHCPQPAASAVILAPESGTDPYFTGVQEALKISETKLRLFGKPTTRKNRRMGVALALGNSIEQARERARECASKIQVMAKNI
jgi:phosphoribosylglycinamide formyltransferase 2